MNLESKRLILKPLSLEDISENYINWLNDKDVCKYNSHGEDIYTKEKAIDYISTINKDQNQKVFAVIIKDESIHIGNISLQNIDIKNNNAELALLFGEKDFWNKGLATEAAELLIDYAFSKLKMHKIYLGTNIQNIAMQKVAQKLMFNKEGILKDQQLKNNSYTDIIIYALINN